MKPERSSAVTASVSSMQPAYAAALRELFPLPENLPRQLRRTISVARRELRSHGLQLEWMAAKRQSRKPERSSYIISVKGGPRFKPPIGLEKIMPEDYAMQSVMNDIWSGVIDHHFAWMDLQLQGRTKNHWLCGEAAYHVEIVRRQLVSQQELSLTYQVTREACEEFKLRVKPDYTSIKGADYPETSFVFKREGTLEFLITQFTTAILQAAYSLNVAIERSYVPSSSVPALSQGYQSRRFTRNFTLAAADAQAGAVLHVQPLSVL